MTTTDRVTMGEPVTTEQAVRAVLRMIHSPIIGDVDLDTSVGALLRRVIDKAPFLSSGEQKLVAIAESIWRGPVAAGAHISALGGLDRTIRRKVIIVLAYFYLGRDVALEVDTSEFAGMFGQKG